ncbi:hypothetical protein G6F65_021673 [Rhizopus arrhizus]|nr:hypothetical protein G6F65_021673 [Rhizopus arrhizus]
MMENAQKNPGAANLTDIPGFLLLGGGVAVQHRMAYQGEYFVERYGAGAAEATPPVKRMLERGVNVSAGTDATRVAPWAGCGLRRSATAWTATPRCACGPRTSRGSRTNRARKAASPKAGWPTWSYPTATSSPAPNRISPTPAAC